MTQRSGTAQPFPIPESARAAIEESGRTVEELAVVEPEDVQPQTASGSTAATCCFCGAEVVSLRTAYQRVRGWTQPRSAGGANQITGRELLDEYACGRCVDKIRRGVDPGQAALL